MQPSVQFKKIWEDDDMSEILIITNDGINSFSVKIYVGHQEFDSIHKKLEIFKNQIYGGITEIDFGCFGQEYANGAFNARLHFVQNQRGRIFITIKMESEYFEFGLKKVASEANIYLISEPALLDNFIKDFKYIDKELNTEVIFECIEK